MNDTHDIGSAGTAAYGGNGDSAVANGRAASAVVDEPIPVRPSPPPRRHHHGRQRPLGRNRRGLPRIAGHERGTDNIRRITHAAGEIGIQYLTLWAFSTENWRRPPDEIEGIMRILGEAIERETEELHRQGAQLRHIGSLDGLARPQPAAPSTRST